MTREQALPFINQLVRVKTDEFPHRGRCFLVELVGKDRARVMPFKHKGTVVVDLSRITPWKSANNAWQERIRNRESKKSMRKTN